jgi:hypothetical protein
MDTIPETQLSDSTRQAGTTAGTPSWLGRHIRVAVAGVLAFLVVVVGGAWWLWKPSPDRGEQLDPETEWAEVIRRYGIEPVFPPEEDFAVGDLFAQVVTDDDPDTHSGNRVEPSTPFRARAVKLDHVDVTGELVAIYKMVPVFAESDVVPAATGVPPPVAPPLFGNERHALPIAALPEVTVSRSRKAAAGLSVSGGGFLDLAGASEDSERIKLPVVETYGLPSIKAEAALNKYCHGPETAQVCTEETARRSLVPIVGPRVRTQYLSPNTGEYFYPVTIRIFMVNRVYLARTIVNQLRVGRTASGGGGVTAPSPGAKNTDVAGNFGSASSREIGMEQHFARPVAIGYRYVEYELDSHQKPDGP